MKIAIRYYSKTGNTKKLADAIGTALNIPVAEVSQTLTEDVDLLFLGSAVYGAGVANEVKDFIKSIDVKVGKIVNFSTAALLPSTYKQVKKLVGQKGLTISEEEFHCRGSFQMMHKGKPDASDLKEVTLFARKMAGY